MTIDSEVLVNNTNDSKDNLLEALNNNDIEAFENIIKNKTYDPNQLQFILERACRLNTTYFAKLLLNNTDLNINTIDLTVMEIIKQNNKEMIDLFLEYSRDLYKMYSYACLYNNIELIKKILNKDPNMIKNEMGIFWACQHGHLETLKLLLNYGVDPNSRITAASCIKRACENGHLEIVKLLLENGANITYSDIDKAHPIVSEYLNNIPLISKQNPKLYYGFVSKVKIDVKIPKLLEIYKKYSYYYVYEAEFNGTSYNISEIENKRKLLFYLSKETIEPTYFFNI